jgi:hypothetical protein
VVLHVKVINGVQHKAIKINGKKKCENKETISMWVSEIKKDPQSKTTILFQ